MMDHAALAGELVAVYSPAPTVHDMVAGPQAAYWPAAAWIQALYAIVLLISAAFWVFESGIWWVTDNLPLTVSVIVAIAFLAHRRHGARADRARLPPARCWPTMRNGQRARSPRIH